MEGRGGITKRFGSGKGTREKKWGRVDEQLKNLGPAGLKTFLTGMGGGGGKGPQKERRGRGARSSHSGSQAKASTQKRNNKKQRAGPDTSFSLGQHAEKRGEGRGKEVLGVSCKGSWFG